MSDPSAAAGPTLQSLRAQIDVLDLKLLALLNERASLALAVGALKKAQGSVVFRPEREVAAWRRLLAGLATTGGSATGRRPPAARGR